MARKPSKSSKSSASSKTSAQAAKAAAPHNISNNALDSTQSSTADDTINNNVSISLDADSNEQRPGDTAATTADTHNIDHNTSSHVPTMKKYSNVQVIKSKLTRRANTILDLIEEAKDIVHSSPKQHNINDIISTCETLRRYIQVIDGTTQEIEWMLKANSALSDSAELFKKNKDVLVKHILEKGYLQMRKTMQTILQEGEEVINKIMTTTPPQQGSNSSPTTTSDRMDRFNNHGSSDIDDKITDSLAGSSSEDERYNAPQHSRRTSDKKKHQKVRLHMENVKPRKSDLWTEEILQSIYQRDRENNKRFQQQEEAQKKIQGDVQNMTNILQQLAVAVQQLHISQTSEKSHQVLEKIPEAKEKHSAHQMIHGNRHLEQPADQRTFTAFNSASGRPTYQNLDAPRHAPTMAPQPQLYNNSPSMISPIRYANRQPSILSPTGEKINISDLALINNMINTIPHFNGNREDYNIFINTFHNLVGNSDIDPTWKHTILIQLLTDEARSCIASTNVSEEDYYNLLEELELLYNQSKDRLDYNEHLYKTMGFHPTSYEQMKLDLLRHYSCANILKQEGIMINDKMFIQILVDKLPTHLMKKATKYINNIWKEKPKDGSAPLTFYGFYKAIQQHINDAASLHRIQKDRKVYVNFADTKASEVDKASYNDNHTSTYNKQEAADSQHSRPCQYCQENHRTRECKLSIDEKYKICKEKSYCFNCLSTKHQLTACPTQHRCHNCEGKHHTTLCAPPQNDQHDSASARE